MRRRTFLTTALSAAAARADGPPPPNILFILADDLGAPELGCYGNKVNRTPNLDRLAAGGVRFDTCYATPLCSPSRVEVMTGRYGFRTGFTNFLGRVTTRKERLQEEELTFADVLKPRGYRSGLSGKWQLGRVTPHPTMIVDSGFDEYFSWAWASGGLPPNTNWDGKPHDRYWHPAIVENGKHFPTVKTQYGPNLYSDWIINFMRRQRDRPFLAYYPECLVHEPWDPTPDDPKGGLRANVEYLDKTVGKVLAALDEMKLRDRTIVIFSGDNGTGRNGKGVVIEAGVRVPMIVSGPGIQRGVVSRSLIDFSDVMPTMAALGGASLPGGVTIDGHSFAHILRGERGPEREWIFSYLAYERMLRDKRWLLEGNGKFYDCGESRDGSGYKDVTDSKDPAVQAARARFNKVLEKLPAPPREPATGG